MMAPETTLGLSAALWAFATTAVVFSLMLFAGSLVVSSIQTEALRPMRMTGPAVRRWGGWVLMIVGVWFLVLAVPRSPLLAS